LPPKKITSGKTLDLSAKRVPKRKACSKKKRAERLSVFPLCLALSHFASVKPNAVTSQAPQGADTDAKTSSRDLDSKHAPDLFQLRLSRRIGRTLIEAFRLVTRRLVEM
jgi:hypothetical protein